MASERFTRAKHISFSRIPKSHDSDPEIWLRLIDKVIRHNALRNRTYYGAVSFLYLCVVSAAFAQNSAPKAKPPGTVPELIIDEKPAPAPVVAEPAQKSATPMPVAKDAPKPQTPVVPPQATPPTPAPAPVDPVDPVKPVGPVLPVAPVFVAEPATPVGPWAPVSPIGPKSPWGPGSPVQPV